MICEHCKNKFSSKTSLKHHQRTAKYCLKIQNIEDKKFVCESCDKVLSTQHRLRTHMQICTQYNNKNITEVYEEKIETLKTQYEEKMGLMREEIKYLKEQIEKMRKEYSDVALKAVTRPTTNYKNIQINNYIKQMPPLTQEIIDTNVQNLTLEHHRMGEEGYAKYAMEFPLKGRIVCVDASRNKIKYKDEDGNIIEDLGFEMMMRKLCKALMKRSYELSHQHMTEFIEEGKFTQTEIDNYDFFQIAVALAQYASGINNEIPKKIIRMISRQANKPANKTTKQITVT